MAKKLFFALLTVLTLLVIFIVYQKVNPASKKIFNIANNQMGGSGSQSVTPVTSPTPVNPQGIFIDVAQPVNNSTVGNANVKVSGKTIANADVTVNDQDFKADVQGNFSTMVTLDEGQNDIYVVASDAQGNASEKDIIVNLESTQ